MNDAPDTPKVCEACGGANYDECRWCTNGYQDLAQAARWREFRIRMRTMSGTYAMFQSLIEEVIDRLHEHNSEISRELAAEGRMHLRKWLEGDPGSVERETEAQNLLRFHRRAISLLSR